MCAKEKRRKGKGRAHAAANKRQIYSGQRQSRKYLKHGFVYRIDSITLATQAHYMVAMSHHHHARRQRVMNPSSISSRWSGVVAHLILMPIALIRLISILIKGPKTLHAERRTVRALLCHREVWTQVQVGYVPNLPQNLEKSEKSPFHQQQVKTFR